MRLYCQFGLIILIFSCQIVNKAVGSAKEKIAREVEIGQRAFVDPDNRVVGLLLYDGHLKVVPIESSGLKDSFNVSLDETKVIDLVFLHGCSRPTIALLYENNNKERLI